MIASGAGRRSTPAARYNTLRSGALVARDSALRTLSLLIGGQLLREGVPFREAVVRGSLERISPILMTALTAGLALIPLAVGGGEPGNELQTPMAIVILGGLLSATALNMLVLPALYWLWGEREVAAEQLPAEVAPDFRVGPSRPAEAL
jgi:Cu/Ag efflux pump CusA